MSVVLSVYLSYINFHVWSHVSNTFHLCLLFFREWTSLMSSYFVTSVQH